MFGIRADGYQSRPSKTTPDRACDRCPFIEQRRRAIIVGGEWLNSSPVAGGRIASDIDLTQWLTLSDSAAVCTVAARSTMADDDDVQRAHRTMHSPYAG